jgi:hypothetical protein
VHRQVERDGGPIADVAAQDHFRGACHANVRGLRGRARAGEQDGWPEPPPRGRPLRVELGVILELPGKTAWDEWMRDKSPEVAERVEEHALGVISDPRTAQL